MLKKNLVIVLLLLIIFTITGSVAKAYATTNKQVVMLDLSCLDLTQVSAATPNLLRLVRTGSTGLVKVPLSFRVGPGPLGPLGLYASKILPNDLVNFLAAGPPDQVRPLDSVALVVPGGGLLDRSDSQPGPLCNPLQLPSHIKAGLDALIDSYKQQRGETPIIIISVESLRRATGSKSSPLSSERVSNRQMFRYYDYLIAGISAATDFNSTLLLVSGSGSRVDQGTDGAAFIPILAKGWGFASGVLYSSSTRQKGILTWNDLRATILKVLRSKTTTGSKLKCLPGDWQVIARTQTALVKNYAIRWPLLTGFGFLLIGVILSLTAGTLLRLSPKIIRVLAWVYLYLLIIPAVFLVEVLIDPLNWLSVYAYTLGIAGVLFLAVYFLARRRILQALLLIALLTTGMVMIDALFNGQYEHKAFLGYSVVAGARYYGIGNEYMGILLGAYILGVALSLRYWGRWRREILWAGTILISVILIHPYLGADVGGGITAVLGLGVTNYFWLQQPVRIKELAKLVSITLILLTLAGLWDLKAGPEAMTHLGQLLLSVHDHGAGAFVVMAKRKLELNMRLISSAPMTLALIGALMAVPFVYRYPPPQLRPFINKHADIIAGFTGLSVTALIGLLTNDSGIVSAALIFVFGIGLLIPFITKETQSFKN